MSRYNNGVGIQIRSVHNQQKTLDGPWPTVSLQQHYNYYPVICSIQYSHKFMLPSNMNNWNHFNDGLFCMKQTKVGGFIWMKQLFDFSDFHWWYLSSLQTDNQRQSAPWHLKNLISFLSSCVFISFFNDLLLSKGYLSGWSIEALHTVTTTTTTPKNRPNKKFKKKTSSKHLDEFISYITQKPTPTTCEKAQVMANQFGG